MWFYRRKNKIYLDVIEKVISNKTYLIGKGLPEVCKFEKEFAEFLGVADTVALNSGTDALIHALQSFGIGVNNEVIVPAFSFISTASSVRWVGAVPKFVDINEKDFTIDSDRLESAINLKTMAIIPVHLFGHPAPMKNILEIARRHNLFIIEDAAQSIGAAIDDKLSGTLGDAGCFSFSSNKPLAAFGNGGTLVFKDASFTKRVRIVSSYGARYHYVDYPFIGNNSRMQEIQAAILRCKLPHLSQSLDKRKLLASCYDDCLSGIGDLILPSNCSGRIYYRYVIRSKRRDDLIKYIRAKLNSRTSCLLSINYPVPLPYFEVFSHLGYEKGDFPVAEKISKEVLSLPLSEELKESDILKVCGVVKDFFK